MGINELEIDRIEKEIDDIKVTVTALDRKYFEEFGSEIIVAISKVSHEIRGKNIAELQMIWKPSHEHYQFKVAFWRVFTECIERGIRFDPKDVIRRARTNGYFFMKILEDPVKLWWLMLPNADYKQQSEAMLYKAMQAKSDILDLPVVETVETLGKDGQVITSERTNQHVLNAKLRLIKDIEDREEGPVETRISQRTQRLPSAPLPAIQPVQFKTIDAEIKSLEAKLEEIPGPETNRDIHEVPK